MKSFFEETIMKIRLCLLCVIVLSSLPISLHGQQGEQHTNDHLFPHPFLAAMGVPDPEGKFHVRLNVFLQQNIGKSKYDISGHLGYGLFDFGGIHLRSLGVTTTPLTEIIGMIGLWHDARRLNGISLLGIVGIPTGPKDDDNAHHGLAYLFGLSGRISIFKNTINDLIVHYDFSTKHYIAESGTVIRIMEYLFAGVDTRTIIGPSQPLIFLMPGLKVKFSSFGFIGVGINYQVTNTSQVKNELYLQVETGNH